MLRTSCAATKRTHGPLLARVYSVPWAAGQMPSGHVGNSLFHHKSKQREGHIDFMQGGRYDFKLRKALSDLTLQGARSDDDGPRVVDLPGVERKSDLPADPITRLFFQAKGEHALYEGTYDNPSTSDTDRVRILKRTTARHDYDKLVKIPIYDFCHRIREAQEQRKRFVIVPATNDTKGCAEILFNHGLVAGFRDFHNDRAFAIELKYFQNDAVIEDIIPVSNDMRTEYEWSPRMCRRMMNSYGIHNKIRIYCMRTWDGRVIDHVQAVKECVGGRGLLCAW